MIFNVSLPPLKIIDNYYFIIVDILKKSVLKNSNGSILFWIELLATTIYTVVITIGEKTLKIIDKINKNH